MEKFKSFRFFREDVTAIDTSLIEFPRGPKTEQRLRNILELSIFKTNPDYKTYLPLVEKILTELAYKRVSQAAAFGELDRVFPSAEIADQFFTPLPELMNMTVTASLREAIEADVIPSRQRNH